MTSYTRPAPSAPGGAAASRGASEAPVQADWEPVLSHAESCNLLFLNGQTLGILIVLFSQIFTKFANRILTRLFLLCCENTLRKDLSLTFSLC
jgi:hypothetical protein